MALLSDEVLDVLSSLGMEGKLNADDSHLATNYERFCLNFIKYCFFVVFLLF